MSDDEDKDIPLDELPRYITALMERIAALVAENARLRVSAERYEAIKRDVTDGELIVCYTGDDGGDIGGPECIDDWCDASIDAAKWEQTRNTGASNAECE
jgi:hypothetical protein